MLKTVYLYWKKVSCALLCFLCSLLLFWPEHYYYVWVKAFVSLKLILFYFPPSFLCKVSMILFISMGWISFPLWPLGILTCSQPRCGKVMRAQEVMHIWSKTKLIGKKPLTTPREDGKLSIVLTTWREWALTHIRAEATPKLERVLFLFLQFPSRSLKQTRQRKL